MPENLNNGPEKPDPSQIEHQLRQSEARTEAIVNTAVDGIITIDSTGRIELFNRAAESIFGYSAEAVQGENICMLMPTPDAEAHDNHLARYMQTGERRIIGIGREVLGQRKDGSVFPLELSISEFQVGEQRFFAGVLREITERRRMEAALRDERNFVSAILATSSALLMVLDRQGRIVRFNSACENITGYRFAEVEGQYFWNIFLPTEEIEPVKAVYSEVNVDYFPNQFESHWLTKSGSRRLIAWHNTALSNDAGGVVNIISTGIDITARRRAEEQSKQHQAELAHMDRLSLMGEMAAGLAHEINQPLTALYAYAKACLRMLHDGTEKSEKFAHALEQIAKTAAQAGLIIRQLRKFVRKQEGSKIKVDLNELIDEVIQFSEAQTRGRNVALQVEIDHRLPRVTIDKVQIEQVMLNLMHNGIDAMANQEKRVLTISVGLTGTSEVQITVRDTGPGLDADQTERIFDAFYTTKPEGMGMGLAISRSIIEAHGGRLWATAELDQGATFHFTLPADSGNSP